MYLEMEASVKHSEGVRFANTFLAGFFLTSWDFPLSLSLTVTDILIYQWFGTTNTNGYLLPSPLPHCWKGSI